MIELMKYGYEYCDVVILEGIMYDEWYSPLFKTANELYGMDIYAYYFDIPFEETVRRHNTRDKKQEFGEDTMDRIIGCQCNVCEFMQPYGIGSSKRWK